MSTTASLRTVAVGDQLLRVSIRPARANRRRDAARVAAASHAGNAGSPAPAPSAGDAAARNGRIRRPAGVPLLLINGIGASLELLAPFVDALDPALEVISFDVPGVGGSPMPARPYRFTGLCRLHRAAADRARP